MHTSWVNWNHLKIQTDLYLFCFVFVFFTALFSSSAAFLFKVFFAAVRPPFQLTFLPLTSSFKPFIPANVTSFNIVGPTSYTLLFIHSLPNSLLGLISSSTRFFLNQSSTAIIKSSPDIMFIWTWSFMSLKRNKANNFFFDKWYLKQQRTTKHTREVHHWSTR